MAENILTAMTQIFSFSSIIVIFLGVFLGLVIGALPGLTVTMGIALLFPVTFAFDGLLGVLMLLGIYVGAVYGGSVSAILLNTPGTPASVATAMDGYPMVKQGDANRALSISTLSSGIGGIISVIALVLVSPLLAKFALGFSAPEYFALAFFGLSIISSVSSQSVIKGLISGVLGLLIATIGVDTLTGYTRFTFDTIYLLEGISFIPILIGLFAFSQALISVEEDLGKIIGSVKVKIKRILPSKEDFNKIKVTILRSSLIGTFIGSIPGTGGDIAAFISYNEAKRFSKEPEKFGKGAPEGIAAPESGNNSVTGGAMVPLLTLGIPGDSVTAIILGALMVQGLQPGPLLFKEQGDQVYSIFLGLLVANICMLILGFLAIKLFIKVVKVPKSILSPLILVLCFVGAFAINNNIVDVYVMLITGIIGYFLIKLKYPISPIVIGLILGPMAEANLRRSLVLSHGDISIFFTRPVSAVLLILAILTLFYPILMKLIKRKRSHVEKA